LSIAITIKPKTSAAPPYYYLSLYKNIISTTRGYFSNICSTGARTRCAGFAQAHPKAVALRFNLIAP
jgi:hypothetical protein